jgi:hypothetical protein
MSISMSSKFCENHDHVKSYENIATNYFGGYDNEIKGACRKHEKQFILVFCPFLLFIQKFD